MPVRPSGIATMTRAIPLILGVLCAPAWSQDDRTPVDPQTPFLYHERHKTTVNDPHPTVAPDGTRFFTNRTSSVDLPLPTETEAFTFAIFGDRTGGPDVGVNVLADAVRDVNLFEPDLVMTVGDMIDGYNRPDAWMVEMREYKAIMGELLCPWFPVAGNHDTYWRPTNDPDRPVTEHDERYEMTFGPLWYAFTHKDCQFIALYSDEGDPETGEKALGRPRSQIMSDEQKAWLKETLERGRSKRHQFLFLHHPRWLAGGYGSDWNDNVHRMLVEAGNVRAVFAGHIHRMRYDPKDGIEYVTLATVGGGQSGIVPEAGWLHHYHLVTVRPQQIALTAYPVGEAMNVREITGELHEAAGRLARERPRIDGAVRLLGDGSSSSTVSITVRNTSALPVDLTMAPGSADARWGFVPDHAHGVLEAGGSRTVTFLVDRPAGHLDQWLERPEIAVDMQMLAPTFRYTIPTIAAALPVDLSEVSLPPAGANLALDLGGGDAVRVPSSVASVPQGPMTLECWLKARSFGNRVGLVAKTEGSEYGIFVSNGDCWFGTHLGGSYRDARAPDFKLSTDRWHHVAGVYDGSEVRLYVDGVLRATVPADPSWERRTNDLPLYIGADVNRSGNPVSFFDGLIDEVRLSTVARYEGERFRPARRLTPDASTRFLYTFDRVLGGYVLDAGPGAHHTEAIGDPVPAPAE